jgi:GSH-dependent disulfide-bond oxidoreductase
LPCAAAGISKHSIQKRGQFGFDPQTGAGETMAQVTLYHWEPNANSGKPMLALEEKGVAWDSRYINMLKFDQHQPDYLAINPQGTIPAMTHGDLVLTESTAIMEYVDEAFDGPALMPAYAQDRWRVRWWMKFMDQWLGPSFSMLGWSAFVGPKVRQLPREELDAAIDRIPLPERRKAWRKAINGDFGVEELAESRRRVTLGIAMLEEELGRRPYVASDSYSLADINVFNSTYSLPVSQPELANRELTPNIMAWLKRVYQRPAVQRTWAMGTTDLAHRYRLVMEEID